MITVQTEAKGWPGAGPGAPAIAIVRASICNVVGRVLCPPGRYDADSVRALVGDRDFAALENAGVIRLEQHGL